MRFASAPASTIAGGSLSHLLPYFADPAQMPDQRLSAITVEDVDRYRRSKVAEAEQLKQDRAEAPEDERGAMTRPLSNGSINKTIRLLATILD